MSKFYKLPNPAAKTELVSLNFNAETFASPSEAIPLYLPFPNKMKLEIMFAFTLVFAMPMPPPSDILGKQAFYYFQRAGTTNQVLVPVEEFKAAQNSVEKLLELKDKYRMQTVHFDQILNQQILGNHITQ